MKGKKLARLIGSLCVVACVVLGVFLVLIQNEDESIFSKVEKPNTEAQSILSKDIERNYPATVREVVRMYARISRCYHNETISEEEFNGLVEFQRKLFDEEFLNNNPINTFANYLSREIESAKEREAQVESEKFVMAVGEPKNLASKRKKKNK